MSKQIFYPMKCCTCGMIVSYTTSTTSNFEKLFCSACANAIILLHNDFSKLKWENILDETYEMYRMPYNTDRAIYSYINGVGLYRLLHKEDS